jgi:glutamate-1-semialdehyde 2,1-aminomutase
VITARSDALFARAKAVSPGGVNSPVRAFQSVGGTPRFMTSGLGAHMTDVDGNEYIDFIGSWGPHILGHRPEPVMRALQDVLANHGTTFGAPSGGEVELAEEIIGAVPSIEMIRLVNSGTEATMSALRVARGFTGRDLTIKFEGCYHGHVDSLLVKAGSGMATLGIADTQGVPKAFADTTLALPYNSVEALAAAFASYGDQIAAVILEPVVGNMGVVRPSQDFLQALRKLTSHYGALLILTR